MFFSVSPTQQDSKSLPILTTTRLFSAFPRCFTNSVLPVPGGPLVLARMHPLDVLQNHRDAARARLVLLRELLGEFCGDEAFKPELLHAVAPDGRTLARAELVLESLHLGFLLFLSPH